MPHGHLRINDFENSPLQGTKSSSCVRHPSREGVLFATVTSNGVDTLFDIVDDTIPVATRRSGGNTAYMVFPNWDVLLQTIIT